MDGTRRENIGFEIGERGDCIEMVKSKYINDVGDRREREGGGRWGYERIRRG